MYNINSNRPYTEPCGILHCMGNTYCKGTPQCFGLNAHKSASITFILEIILQGLGF